MTGSGMGSFLASRWMLYGPVALVAGIVVGGAWYGYGEYQRRERTAAEARQPKAAVDVLSQNFTGKTRAQRTVAVAAPLEGTLESLEVTDGDEVFEGQLLARIRNTGMEAAKQRSVEDLDRVKGKLSDLESQVLAARLEASRAGADLTRVRLEYDNASRAYERQQKLYREGATARKTYEKAEAEYRTLAGETKGMEEAAARSEAQVAKLSAAVEEAKGRVAEAVAELEDADAEMLLGEVKAPVSGLLIGHAKNAGDEVTRDLAKLFEIATELTAMEVVVEIPPVVDKRVSVGARALVQISEAGEAALNGTVREAAGGKAVVEFVSPSAAVRPGMSAQVRFLEERPR